MYWMDATELYTAESPTQKLRKAPDSFCPVLSAYKWVLFYLIPVCADMNPPNFLAASACISLVAWQYAFSVKPAE